MQSYKKYYIPYLPKANVNYIYLLSLYRLAERYEERGIKQDIDFMTFEELADKIGDNIVSANTLRRIVKSEEYKGFLTFAEFGERKCIMLNNDFRGGTGNKQRFVVLCPNTYQLLLDKKDNLLAKYTIYTKYMCGMSGNNADFTANQFLDAFGYSTKSHNTKDKISKYNSLLERERIITIYRNQLEDGKRRNNYIFLDT